MSRELLEGSVWVCPHVSPLSCPERLCDGRKKGRPQRQRSPVPPWPERPCALLQDGEVSLRLSGRWCLFTLPVVRSTYVHSSSFPRAPCVYHSLDVVWSGWCYLSNSKGEIERVLVGLYQERGSPSLRGHAAGFWRGFLQKAWPC